MKPLCACLCVVLLAVLAFSQLADAAIKPGDCEVCLKVMNDITVAAAKDKKLEVIESKVKQLCAKYTERAEKRLCYYIGGSADAATSLLRTISVPISNKVPAEKICEKLKAADSEICVLKYKKDGATGSSGSSESTSSAEKSKRSSDDDDDYVQLDFDKMKIKQMKDLLSSWGEKCDGCAERSDFMRIIKKALPKRSPKAAKLLEEREKKKEEEQRKKKEQNNDDDEKDL